MLLKAGTVLNDRYEILSTVGAGGMADVYRARDSVLQRLVAIKVLKEELSTDAGFVAKFRREAQAVGALNHPNIVGVFDVGEQNGMYYIVMELVEGINLKKYIDKMGAMEEREAVEVAMQVAKGLEAAHSQGIIHRDIKPQNIIISREGKIKVADFGIARMVATETSTTSTMGSVHYISPEQARGDACDARSDIYSLGITLYEMVTGQVPFDGETSVEVALKHLQEPIVPPGELAPSLSRNLENIILKCTQKNPGYRYATMSDLLVDFKKLIVMPDEDFVVLPAEGAGDPNLAMRKEDSDILKLAGISPRKTRWEEGEREKAFDEGVGRAIEMQEEDRVAEEKARRTEKILNYVMLGIGVLILVVIIAMISKACAWLNPTKKTTESTSWVAPEVTTAPRETTVIPTTTPFTMPPTTEPPATTEEPTEPVSTEPEGTVVLRDLIGMDYAEAMDLLMEDGLRVHLEYELVPEDSEFEDNTVVDQSYDPGVSLLLGTEVTLWIATRDSGAVIIPTNIIGKSAEEAAAILREVGLVVSSGTEWEHSPSVPANTVMASDPPIGSLAALGTPVTLIISSGPAMFKVPAILGYTKEQAIAALREAGFPVDTNLQFRTETMASDTYLPNTVGLVEASLSGTTREAVAGESLDLRTVLYITMTDPEPVLPALLGREDIEEAKEELEKMGLSVKLKYENSTEYPVGQICWVTRKDGTTDIPEGTVLKKGTVVMLHISALVVPKNLVGLTVAEAKEILEAAGIPYSFKSGKAPEDPEAVVVSKVTPKGGTVLKDDEEVVITFRKPTDPTEPTEEPTEESTEEPTEAPTEPPTEAPTEPPTEAPTEPPTEAPTEPPTEPSTEASLPKMPTYAGRQVSELFAELRSLGVPEDDIVLIYGTSKTHPEKDAVYFVSSKDVVESEFEIAPGTELEPGNKIYIFVNKGSD
nr:protein kinase [Lachnospiraceae bacterium]